MKPKIFRNRVAAITCLTVVALLFAPFVWAQPADLIPLKDPNSLVKPGDKPLLQISSAVHGFFINTDGKQIKVTPEFILQTQDAYVQNLKRQLTPTMLPAYQKILDVISSTGSLSEADRVWSNAILIGFLLNTVKVADEPTVRSRNQSLLSSYAKLIGSPIASGDLAASKTPQWVKMKQIFTRDDIASIVGREDIASIVGNKGFRYSYSAKCKAAGVPVPPNWDAKINVADDVVSANGWKKQGQLTTNYLTQPGQHPNANTIVYSYIPKTGPKGLCIALPILQNDPGVTPNTVIDALGIICQGISTTGDPNKSNSKACFWDNNGDETLMANTNYKINSVAFKAPPKLPDDNQCTDCHAGENAFIVHPGTPLEAAKKEFNKLNTPNFTSQNNWYSPVQPTWPINPEPAAYPNGNGLCGSCHKASYAGRLPNVNPFGLGGTPPRDNLYKFCYFLLPNVLTQVVNPAVFNPGTMASHVASNSADVTTLYQSCKSLFPYFPATQNEWLQPQTPP